jgi:hypothetical protein
MPDVTALALLIVLHAADGGEISISAEQVTSLRSPQVDGGDKHFSKTVHCMVSLADGKFIAVVERCETVRKKIEEQK